MTSRFRLVVIHPPRSAQPRHAARLAAEMDLVWLQPLDRFPWLREVFHSPMALWEIDGATVAFTVDAAGRACREFRCSERSVAAYADLAASGAGTCPLEAVLPASVAIGEPAQAAHGAVLRATQPLTHHSTYTNGTA